MDNYNNIKQINGYYPLGMKLSNSRNRVVQQFKFSNKELQTANRLNWYDFSARMYDPALRGFTFSYTGQNGKYNFATNISNCSSCGAWS